MIAAVRLTTFATLLAVIAFAGAACTPTAGPLGTPASPVASDASAEPSATDVAPASPSDVPSPSASEDATPTTPASASVPPSTGPTPTPTATASPTGTVIVRAYFVLGSHTDNAGLVPVLREIPATKAVARAAMTALLAGPKGAELAGSPAMYSGIPDATRLIDLTINDRVATVTLSKEWTGAAATFQQDMATAQVVYTLTQFSTVKQVRIAVEGGQPGGTQARSDFQQIGILPAIFVDRPAWGAAAGNPLKLTGIANVFEATFRVQVLDAKGNILADQQVMASCGTGCWGSFSKSVAYTIGKAQYGKLRVFEPSAKNGAPVNVTEYRVWLTP
jgi:hypothetical protein